MPERLQQLSRVTIIRLADDPRGHTVEPMSSAQLTAGFSLTVAKGASTTYANETTQAATFLLLSVTAE